MSCNKVSYSGFTEASQVLSDFKRRNKNRKFIHDKIPKRVYKCEVCGKFHLTSLKRKKNRKRIKSNF